MADIPGNSSTTVTVAINGAPQTGAIEINGDHDWFRVNLTAGQTYVFAVNATALGDLQDSVLWLRDSAGVELAVNDDRYFDGEVYYSAITFTATATGTLFLDVAGYSTATGNYLVSASTVPAADILGSTATTQVLQMGTTQGSAIGFAGDQDWFAVNLTAGQRYTFRVDPGATGELGDSILRLMDSAGVQVVWQDDISYGSGNTYSSITFTPSASGTYFLNVSGFGSSTGNYLITATERENQSTYSLDQIADQLINGYWDESGRSARHFDAVPGDTLDVNITALTTEGQYLAREALALWSDVTGLLFNEVASGGDIVFDDEDSGAYASSVTSGGFIVSSSVNISKNDWLPNYGTTLNSYSFQTYVHEIGHALGLGHAGNYNGAATWGTDESYLNDVWSTTIMSYFDQTDNMQFQALGFSRLYVVSPMLGDIVAVQQMYGTSTVRNTATTYGFGSTAGRDIYDASINPDVSYTIYDAGGLDQLRYTGFAQDQLIDLNAEAFSNIGGHVGNVTIARGVVIENASGGSGNDTIYGNAVANKLYGNGGNDVLEGRDGDDWLIGNAGADVLRGGAGNDIYLIDASDTVTEASGEGTADEVRASIDYTLGSNVERLRLQGTAVNGTGNGAANDLIGNSVANVLSGLGGNDRLYGFGGNDTLLGGTANDNLYGGGGLDRLEGGDGNDLLRGDAGADVLLGGAGDDNLGGGDGNDTVTGGSGRDIMYGDAGADIFVFANGDFAGMTNATADKIQDFVIGTDRIDLSAVDANVGAAGDQAFSFIGGAAFSGAAGQLRAYTSGTLTIIEGNTNADAVADFWIVLNGAMAVGAGDFVL